MNFHKCFSLRIKTGCSSSNLDCTLSSSASQRTGATVHLNTRESNITGAEIPLSSQQNGLPQPHWIVAGVMQSTESTEFECNKPESFKIVGLATVGPCHLEVHSFRTLVTWLSPNLQRHICASFPTNSITQSEFLRLATKHSLSQSQSLKIYTVPLCCHRLWYQCQQAK